MNHMRIRRLQKENGISEMQQLINSGMAWKLEGRVGREAMEMLRSGACMLPIKSYKDYYGNHVPSRYEVKDGTKGSYSNCRDFWEGVEEGSIVLF